MMAFKVRIPRALASSIRADAPRQLVGLAIRPADWPELVRLGDRHNVLLSPYMMFRKVEWRSEPGRDDAQIRAELIGIDCHRFYPFAREILTRSCDTIKLARDEHAGTLLDPVRTNGPLKFLDS